MADKELLELAAKAAGLKLAELGGRIVIQEVDGQPVYWNPLTDDGDALRLAVKLSISIISPDNIESVRRAIVRAAAEIGRTK